MTPVRFCAYEWVSVGDDRHHLCTVHGEHEHHRCGDDGCDAWSPVRTRGGRRRDSHGHPR